MNVSDSSLPRLVIIGGGFGGIQLARSLRNQACQVVLIDKRNYHTFQPLLYQVASAGLEPDSIAYPIRKVFRNQKNFVFRNAGVQHIDPVQQKVVTDAGELSYDHVIIATGSTTNFFGMEKVSRYSRSMKSIPEALDLRSLMLEHFEDSLLTHDLHERDALMNFVIVGGGPTGVELAGALAELKTHVLPKDYPDLDVRRMNIHILEGSDRLLPTMSKEASTASYKFLTGMGVNIWLGTRVSDYDGHTVSNDSGKVLLAKTLIWAAGVKGNTIGGLDPMVKSRGNRILTDAYNRVKGHSNVFAIGDVAMMPSEAYPDGHPMVAQVAIQQGKQLAKNFKAEWQGKAWTAFGYRDKGSMATIGRNKAVADLPRFRFQGFFAWFVWMFIHLISLIGFRNKVITLFNWAWSYIHYDKGVRLIIRPSKKRKKDPDEMAAVSPSGTP